MSVGHVLGAEVEDAAGEDRVVLSSWNSNASKAASEVDVSGQPVAFHFSFLRILAKYCVNPFFIAIKQYLRLGNL